MEPDVLFARLNANRRARYEALELIVRLRSVLDGLEVDIVTSARRSGETWAEIGTALGVTRQAARQRLDRRVKR